MVTDITITPWQRLSKSLDGGNLVLNNSEGVSNSTNDPEKHWNNSIIHQRTTTMSVIPLAIRELNTSIYRHDENITLKRKSIGTHIQQGNLTGVFGSDSLLHTHFKIHAIFYLFQRETLKTMSTGTCYIILCLVYSKMKHWLTSRILKIGYVICPRAITFSFHEFHEA